MAAQTSQESLDRAVLRTGIPDGSRILIAVSGGPDSVALLETLSGLVERKRVRWQLRVGHVNHGLRGEESDRDEEFVRALAGSLALAVDVGRVDTMARARERGLSQEAAARELRYASLRRMLYEWQGDVIATGHTQDDQ